MKLDRSHSKTAILVIDVINDLEFAGGEKLLRWARKMADVLTELLPRARKARTPVIYVNDNFGHWRSNFKEVIEHCTRPEARGRQIVRRLTPAENDYFILKPKHSGFFSTSLVPLLEFLGVKHVILTGIATNLCVLYTAHDAQMHEYALTVLSDCCAAESDADHNWALDQLKRFVDVRVCRADQLSLNGKRSKR